jgi:DNA-binding MarR family transcriptional regulator
MYHLPAMKEPTAPARLPQHEPQREPQRPRLRAQLLEELLWHTPAGALRAVRRRQGGGLSLVHLNVLTILDIEGSLPMRALAEALDVSQASATGIVDRMEQRGLVERRRDAHDRRVIRVAPTGEGMAVLGSLIAERREHMGHILDELTEEELEGLLRGLRAVRAARERHEDAPHMAGHRGGMATGPHPRPPSATGSDDPSRRPTP